MKRIKQISLIILILIISFSNFGCKEMKDLAEEGITGNRANSVQIVKHKEKIDAMGIGDKSYRTIYVTVKNTSSRLIEAVTLKGIWYDSEGNIVGTGPGIGMNIPAGKTRVVEISGIKIEKAVEYKIEVETGL